MDPASRQTADRGREAFVPSSFATVASLVEPNDDARCKLRDMSTLASAEIVDVAAVRGTT